MEYFKSERINEHLIRIIEIGGVCCYLAIGDNKAALLDTGSGYGNIEQYVKTLTDKPILVLLTHGHHDHMGGAALFEEVYMNPDDMEVFHFFGNMEKRLMHAKELPETASFTEKDLVPLRTAEIKPIKDGDTFDLGNLTIKMILVKGHTPGIMCPLLMEERSIIFGDACGVGVMLHDEFSATVSEYRKSLLKLKQYENDYDNIYRNHGTFASEKELLDNVIECCDLILKGKDEHIPVTIHGYELFSAHKIDKHGRVDGKEGNIMYTLDKV